MTNNKKYKIKDLVSSAYKYILFDWDGCLARTLDIWFDTAKELLIKWNVKFVDDQIVKGFGDWEFAKKLGVSDNEAFNKELIFIVNEKLKSIKLYDGAIKLLQILKDNNKKIALVTTGIKPSVLPALEKYELTNLFDVILTAEDVIKHKPDPEVVNKAIEFLGANKDETLIIGDGPKDILAGKAAGITTVSFYPEENHRFYSEADIKSYGADFVIKKLSDLVNIVN